jgi:hypothetical protein
VAWDFRDRLGRTAEAGLHFVRLESASDALTRRLMLTD